MEGKHCHKPDLVCGHFICICDCSVCKPPMPERRKPSTDYPAIITNLRNEISNLRNEISNLLDDKIALEKERDIWISNAKLYDKERTTAEAELKKIRDILDL